MAFNLPSLLKSETGSLWKNRRNIDNILDAVFTNFYQSLPALSISQTIPKKEQKNAKKIEVKG